MRDRVVRKLQADHILTVMALDIQEVTDNGIVRLALSGHLDSDTSKKLEERFTESYERGERYFIFDCAGLEYISSAGLRVLLLAAKRLERTEGDVVLAALQGHVQRVFDLTGFSGIFNSYATADEAAAQIK